MHSHSNRRITAVIVLSLAAAAPVVAQMPTELTGVYALDNVDANGDGERDVSDAIELLAFLYIGGAEPVPLALCFGGVEMPLNGDANRDGERDVSDVVLLLDWMFQGGPEPAAACGEIDRGEGAGHGRALPRIVPIRGRHLTRVYENLAAEFWRWIYRTPLDSSPFVTSNCTTPQDTFVRFIGASFGAGTVTCELPVGSPVFFPTAGFFNDYPCPDPAFEPAPGQTLEEFLAAGAAAGVDLIGRIEIFVDGVGSGDLRASQRVTTGLVSFTADPSLVAIDPCVTGSEQVGVADGYYVLLVGFSAGEHSLRVVLEFAGDVYEVTNLVTFVPRRG